MDTLYEEFCFSLSMILFVSSYIVLHCYWNCYI